MAISSINSNLAALLAQSNIGAATTATSNNVAALSSGNRIVNASTDVSALATGTALQSQVNILSTALSVASQGSSLLQVADGALAQIQSILQRQQAIATQAQSGSLSNTQLGFLDLEFQNLTSEIDQLAGSTNFNGVKLLDGALSQSLTTTISSAASTQASGSYTVTTNFAADDTLTIGGTALQFKASATAGYVTVGATIAASVANVVAFINGAASNSNLSAAQKAAFSKVIATQVGNSGTFTLTARNGGTLGEAYALGGIGGTGTGVVVRSGKNADSTAYISGITAASTSSVLTSASNTGGFFSGGQISFGGSFVTGSTISATTTLETLVANINANTTTSGVSAYVTGSGGNYTLVLKSSNAALGTGIVNTGTSAVTNTLYANTTGTALNVTNNTTKINAASTSTGTTTQVITFHGLTSGSTVLTEGNSTFKSGTLNWDTDSTANTNAGTFTSLATIALGTTTLDSLVTSISGVTNFSAALVTTSGEAVLTITHTSAGSNDAGLHTLSFGQTGDSLGSYSAHGTANNSYGAGGFTVANHATAALTGGIDDGIGVNSTVGRGSILDNIIVGQNQQVSQVTISYPNIAPSDLNSSSNFGGSTPSSVTVAGVQFNFTTNANSASQTEIQIGSTLQETLQNAAAKINSYHGKGSEDYQFNQVIASASATTLTVQTKNVGSALTEAGATVAVTASGSGAAVAGTLANGSTSGIDTSGVNNDAFVGTVKGFTASYTGTANTINLSLTVGGITYSASNVSTNPTANTSVQLVSTDVTGKGGFLTIQLQALKGNTVSSSADANNFASRLDTAISGLTFYQDRKITSYDPAVNGSSIVANGVAIGSLNGSSISLASNNFENATIQGVSVAAPQGSGTNGVISFTINGETYSSDSNIGTTLNANTTYKFVNTSDPNKFITFKTGSTTTDFSTSANANALQTALSKAFGSGGSALTFQVGTTSTDTIGVSIGNSKTSSLFGGESINVLSQLGASNAAAVLQVALNSVTALRASVGALEERFTYASNAIQNAVQNQGAAKSNLLDTDVAATSTAYATSQVQLQAGIAVLAQANQLQQNLLKLLS